MNLSLDKANLQPWNIITILAYANCHAIRTDSVVIECGFEFERRYYVSCTMSVVKFNFIVFWKQQKLVAPFAHFREY